MQWPDCWARARPQPKSSKISAARCANIATPIRPLPRRQPPHRRPRLNSKLLIQNRLRHFPGGMAVFPTGKVIFPAGSRVVPVGIEIIPCGNKALPMGMDASPVGKMVLPAGSKIIPSSIGFIPVGMEAIPFGKMAVPACPGGLSRYALADVGN